MGAGDLNLGPLAFTENTLTHGAPSPVPKLFLKEPFQPSVWLVPAYVWFVLFLWPEKTDIAVDPLQVQVSILNLSKASGPEHWVSLMFSETSSSKSGTFYLVYIRD